MGSTRKDGRRRTSRPRKAQSKMKKPCRTCKKKFLPGHNASLYCSDKCRIAFIADQKVSKKTHFVIPSLVEETLPTEYDGHSDAYIANRSRKNERRKRLSAEALAVPIKCKREECGKEFVRAAGQQKFCSFDCQPLQQARIKSKAATVLAKGPRASTAKQA